MTWVVINNSSVSVNFCMSNTNKQVQAANSINCRILHKAPSNQNKNLNLCPTLCRRSDAKLFPAHIDLNIEGKSAPWVAHQSQINMKRKISNFMLMITFPSTKAAGRTPATSPHIRLHCLWDGSTINKRILPDYRPGYFIAVFLFSA